MITVFVNNEGYYISGGSVEIARRCHQKCDTDDIHHQYKVLASALAELCAVSNTEDILVYNNTRIIDEVNRKTQPLDEGCQVWSQYIRREILSSIRSMVYFGKKSSSFINKNIQAGFSNLLSVDGEAIKNDMLAKQERQNLEIKQNALERFRNGHRQIK